MLKKNYDTGIQFFEKVQFKPKVTRRSLPIHNDEATVAIPWAGFQE